MATSVRSVAASCFDIEGPFSIRRDIYGYIWGPISRELRLRRHLELVRGTAFNLCPFLVGHEPGFPPGSEFSPANVLRMQAAIDVMRELYAQVDVGVRRIFWRYIPVDEAGDFTVVDGSEATELTEAFSGPNDGIDVFFVTTVSDAGGWSITPGPCDKDASGRTGAVMELKGTDLFTGILLAHEVGHYLGLEHGDDVSDITNVMGHDDDGNGIGSLDAVLSVNLTDEQGDEMKSHCSIRPSC